jgi:ADP-ribosylglycohydrolase
MGEKTMPDTERFERAMLSLEGLSVGDAFGERFFAHRRALAKVWAGGDRAGLKALDLGAPPWRWTDDTAMAFEIVTTLREHGTIDPQDLAQRFAARYHAEPWRGYGGAMHGLLPKLADADTQQTAPAELFGGHGSYGNGSAMRAAPLGAYFADDLDAVALEAGRAAKVTHTHPEGVAGAIATAAAAALAWRSRGQPAPAPAEFLEQVLSTTPPGDVASGLRRARDLNPETSVRAAAEILGSGERVTAQDTVPFAIWSAARNLDDYAEALWSTLEGLGDMDTTCAMAGGIVIMRAGLVSIPAEWRSQREPLPMAGGA